MAVLLKRTKEIKEHWHQVAHDLGAILPGASNAYRAWFEETAGTVATLRCQQFQNETALRRGEAVPVVPLIAAVPDESPLYWINWYEEWLPQRGRATKQLRFQTTALTVFYGAADTPKQQVLRAEWAGVEDTVNGIDAFQGRGAAHPHWHLDAVRTYIADFKQRADDLARDAELRRDLVVDQIREFGSEEAEQDIAALLTSAPLSLPGDQELGWTHAHLAVCARWAERPWPGAHGPHDMHANGPEDLLNIRNWISSCVRYLQAEINKAQLGLV